MSCGRSREPTVAQLVELFDQIDRGLIDGETLQCFLSRNRFFQQSVELEVPYAGQQTLPRALERLPDADVEWRITDADLTAEERVGSERITLGLLRSNRVLRGLRAVEPHLRQQGFRPATPVELLAMLIARHSLELGEPGVMAAGQLLHTRFGTAAVYACHSGGTLRIRTYREELPWFNVLSRDWRFAAVVLRDGA